MSHRPVLKDCTLLSDVGKFIDKNIDLVGVVADFRPPMSSRGTDWTVTFTICDKSCPSTESGICVRIFKPTVELLPQIRSNGDTILIRFVRVKYFSGKLVVMSSYNTSWIISYIPTHPKAPPLTTTYPSTVKAKPFELEHMKHLHEWWSVSGDTAFSGSVPGRSYQAAGQGTEVVNDRKRKFSLIRDMQFDCFYDIIGLVVKTFPGVGNYTVYITDYSKNPMLHAYEWGRGVTTSVDGDDDDYDYTGRNRTGGGKDWPGPWGQYTLQVTLWDVHAVAARQILYDGAYLRLQNVRAKRNGDGRLEGALHGDRRYPDRVDLQVIKNLDDPLVRQVIQRSKEYTRRFESDKSRYEQEMQVKIAEHKKKEAEKQARKDEGNRNVRCEKPGHPVTPISQVLNPIDSTAPFVNRNYHIYCRVIDYLPKRLEDFSVPNKSSDNRDEEDTFTKPWVWRFALLVEGDDGATMRIIVEGNDAEYLLKMEAVNLRKDHRALQELREKLFVLWGNLEERRTQRDSNQSLKRNKRARHSNAKKRRECDELGKPLKHRDGDVSSGPEAGESGEEDAAEEDAHGKMFEACVKEYGVPVGDGWKRLHRLFGTVIM